MDKPSIGRQLDFIPLSPRAGLQEEGRVPNSRRACPPTRETSFFLSQIAVPKLSGLASDWRRISTNQETHAWRINPQTHQMKPNQSTGERFLPGVEGGQEKAIRDGMDGSLLAKYELACAMVPAACCCCCVCMNRGLPRARCVGNLGRIRGMKIMRCKGGGWHYREREYESVMGGPNAPPIVAFPVSYRQRGHQKPGTVPRKIQAP